MTTSDVAKTGIGSKTQKSRAAAKMAINRCSTVVRLSIGIQREGSSKIRRGIAIEISSLV